MSNDPFTQALNRRAKRGEIESTAFKGPKKPKKMLKRDWVGRKVRLKRDIENNAGQKFLKGEEVWVTDTYRGKFALKKEGVAGRITRVPESDLELVLNEGE